jgi:hypothetical protein
VGEKAALKMLLASLFLAPALAIGPSCKDNTWSLVFFRAEGDLYTGRGCTGAATSSCPFPASPLPLLLLSCCADCVGHGTLSLLHGLLFPLAFKATLLVLVLFLPLVFELLASCPT